MSANFFTKLINPRLPAAAISLDAEAAVAVMLERRRNGFSVRRAGYVTLPSALVNPNFSENNISDVSGLASALAELASDVGLGKQHRWSIALPEVTARTAVLSLESEPGSRGELDDMLRWKTERSFGMSLNELRVAHQRLQRDARGRARYLVTGVHLSVLAEYEAVFTALGWHAGLILPRHLGETWWLMQGDRERTGESLLISWHREGFTAVLMRDQQPLIVRSVVCDDSSCADELYRLLLFYRDRVLTVSAAEAGTSAAHGIDRLLVAGNSANSDGELTEREVIAIIEETLSIRPRTLNAEEVGVRLPSKDISFSLIAAPAGLAALAWN